VKNKLKVLFNGFIIAGVLQLIIGMIFLIRAGQPYQDPNVEMVIEWTSYNISGTYSVQCGLGAAAAGVVGLVLTFVLGKKKRSKF